jgi:hypothetical protein
LGRNAHIHSVNEICQLSAYILHLRAKRKTAAGTQREKCGGISPGEFFYLASLRLDFSIGRSNLNKFAQQTPKNRRIPLPAYNYRAGRRKREEEDLKAPADATHTSLWMLLRNMCSSNFVTKALNF